MDNCSQVLSSLSEILIHIQEVQQEVSELSHESMLVLGRVLSKAEIELGPKELSALQHQDILSQQLGAASESIVMINNYIEKYIYAINVDSNLMSDDFSSLDKKLKASLMKAKDRKNAFSGQAFEDKQEEIEFF